MSGASTPNGAQLPTWRQRAADATKQRKVEAEHNRKRRLRTWERLTVGSPTHARHQATHTTHADRAQVCAAHGVPNTGRQWRRLRKALARQERAS